MLKQLLAAVLLSCSFAAAQTATGPPETVLAGIDLRHTTIAAIQKLYGQQDAMYAVPPDPYPQGTKLYKWGRLTVTLRVLTEPSPQGEVIKAVQVEGQGEPNDKPINKTGRGLKLSAKASEINKIYGREPSGAETKIQWPDGTILIVTLNDKQRVGKLELRAP